MAAVETVGSLPWWKEPTKDQWYAYVAAWAGWTLDAFDFTAFLLIIAPIAKEFDVPVPEEAAPGRASPPRPSRRRGLPPRMDSPVEQEGFEPPVPPANGSGSLAGTGMPQQGKAQSRKCRLCCGGPRVRIPLAPAKSLRTFGP
jgi:hypothetical protein